MTTAIVYARVSSASQAEEEVSIPAQLDAARRRASRDGVTILREFLDEGRSAFVESNRRNFEAAIDYAVTHEVGIFYTWSSSRFARNKIEAATFKRSLERAGVKLVYLSVNLDLSTDEGWLLDSIFEVMDEQRSRDTSKDTRRSLIHNAQQGFWVGGIAPFGYQSVPAPGNTRRKRLLPREDEARLVREVFEMRAAGLGGKAIADRFNVAEVRYRMRRWTKAAVLDLLRNRAVLGQTIFNKIEPRTKRQRPESDWLVIQTHEPIIDMELWSTVQAALSAAAEPHLGKGRTRSTHPYTGLLRCGKCGGRLTVETARGRNDTYSYYSCKTAKLGGDCQGARYRAEALDDALNAFVFARLLTPETLRGFTEEVVRIERQQEAGRQAQLREIAAKVGALRARNANLYDVLELHGRDAPDLADLSARLRANQAELKALDERAARIDAEIMEPVDLAGIDFGDVADTLRDMLAHRTDPNILRTFYAGFIEAIDVTGETATIHYNPARMVAATSPAVHSLKRWGRSRSLTRTVGVRLPAGVLARRGGVSLAFRVAG